MQLLNRGRGCAREHRRSNAWGSAVGWRAPVSDKLGAAAAAIDGPALRERSAVMSADMSPLLFGINFDSNEVCSSSAYMDPYWLVSWKLAVFFTSWLLGAPAEPPQSTQRCVGVPKRGCQNAYQIGVPRDPGQAQHQCPRTGHDEILAFPPSALAPLVRPGSSGPRLIALCSALVF